MAYDKNPHAVKPEEYGFPLKLKNNTTTLLAVNGSRR